MSSIWIAAAVCGGILFLTGLGRALVGLRPQPEMRGLPMTALETMGWVGLGITGAVGAGLGSIVAWGGVAAFDEDKAGRLVFWCLLVAGLGIGAWARALLKRRNGEIVADERDRAILARSFSVESMTVLIALVAWTVGLTEAFWDRGNVPLGYIQLLFWTTLISGALGRSVGIVLGYRREIPVDG